MAARERRKGEPFKVYRMRLNIEEKEYQKRIRSGRMLWNSSKYGTAERAGNNSDGSASYRQFTGKR